MTITTARPTGVLRWGSSPIYDAAIMHGYQRMRQIAARR
jgi:hypothetical protein